MTIFEVEGQDFEAKKSQFESILYEIEKGCPLRFVALSGSLVERPNVEVRIMYWYRFTTRYR